jgi:ribA/ribD-fused uncharacterized protein
LLPYHSLHITRSSHHFLDLSASESSAFIHLRILIYSIHHLVLPLPSYLITSHQTTFPSINTTNNININIMAASITKDASEPIYFFSTREHPHGIFSQHKKCTFTDPDLPNIKFNCAEQYMMYNKAKTFNDTDTASEILIATNPKAQKTLGGDVKKFEDAVWNTVKCGIVERGNYLKFTQNDKFKKVLLDTEDRLLVEASKWDKIWGIGFTAGGAKKVSKEKWGQNLLGIALMNVREKIRKEDAEDKGAEQVDDSDQDTTDDEADEQPEPLGTTLNSSATRKRKYDSITEDPVDESAKPKTTSSKKACIDLTADED